jgi:hypothetical protein
MVQLRQNQIEASRDSGVGTTHVVISFSGRIYVAAEATRSS